MKLYASPLQGFTEAPWRNIHHELFGGIDAYYTPFVRVEKGEFRNKDIRDIEKDNNKVTCLIPQLIASTPAELAWTRVRRCVRIREGGFPCRRTFCR